MAPQASLETRWSNIRSCLTITVKTLELLTDALNSSALKPIFLTMGALLTTAKNLKSNKKECTELLEDTYQLLSAIIALHIESKTSNDFLSPELNHLGNFTQTVNIIYNFVEAQQSSRIRNFFRQSEMSELNKACRAGLQCAFENFKVDMANIQNELAEMNKIAHERHEKLLAVIKLQSDTSSTDGGSSAHKAFSSVYGSSNSLTMLPSKPKIFHGRESELSEILDLFTLGAPRIAILGAGGMGKTSLAREVLHQIEVADRFKQHRFFVTCESASNVEDLVNHIGAHLGVRPAKNLRKKVLECLSKAQPTFLVLDNLETVWEPTILRPQVEELLSLLSGIEHLALMITLRGAERPAKVQWTRPFLPPLKPLSHSAARQIFIDIADDIHQEQEVEHVLQLTDNLPLAVTLMAYLVDSEGCPTVLSHWEKEKTSLVSNGYDKRSNLDFSISMSLSSPRITPESIWLLSLLSLLPDGISEVELLHTKLPILHESRASLLRTSLAYVTDQGHLKALVPIREHMQKFQPPPNDLVQLLSQHYRKLTHIYHSEYETTLNASITMRIHANFSNIQSIILWDLKEDISDRAKIIEFILDFNFFSRITDRAIIPMMARVPEMLPHPLDHTLNLRYLTELLSDVRCSPPNESSIKQAFKDMHAVNDIDTKWKFYWVVAWRYSGFNNLTAAIQMCHDGLALLQPNHNPCAESTLMNQLAHLKWKTGDCIGGQADARRALWLAKLCGNFATQSSALGVEAKCCIGTGQFAVSVPLCEKALDLLNLISPSPSKHHHLLFIQAEAHRLKSEYTEAHATYTKSLRTASPGQNPYEFATTLIQIGEIDILLGVPRHAIDPKIKTAREMFQNLGMLWETQFCDLFQVDLDLRDGNTRVKITEYEKFFHQWGGGDPHFSTYCLERLNRGYRDDLTTWPTVWLAHSVKFKMNLEIHKALQYLGHNFLLQEELETAGNLFATSLNGFTYMDVHRSRAECMLELGEIAKRTRDPRRAKELWTEAKPLFERSSQNKQVQEVENRLAELSQVDTEVDATERSFRPQSVGEI